MALSKDYAVVGTVKYDALTLNKGQHYDPASGIFTAPIEGTSSFHVSTWASVYVSYMKSLICLYFFLLGVNFEFFREGVSFVKYKYEFIITDWSLHGHD